MQRSSPHSVMSGHLCCTLKLLFLPMLLSILIVPSIVNATPTALASAQSSPNRPDQSIQSNQPPYIPSNHPQSPQQQQPPLSPLSSQPKLDDRRRSSERHSGRHSERPSNNAPSRLANFETDEPDEPVTIVNAHSGMYFLNARESENVIIVATRKGQSVTVFKFEWPTTDVRRHHKQLWSTNFDFSMQITDFVDLSNFNVRLTEYFSGDETTAPSRVTRAAALGKHLDCERIPNGEPRRCDLPEPRMVPMHKVYRHNRGRAEDLL